MSKKVTFTADVFPYCLGDVVTLNDEELKAVDKIAKARKQKVYEDGGVSEVPSTAESDKNAKSEAAQAKKADAAADVEAELAAEASKKADAESHNSPAGQDTPGSAAGTTVKTAAAK